MRTYLGLLAVLSVGSVGCGDTSKTDNETTDDSEAATPEPEPILDVEDPEAPPTTTPETTNAPAPE